MVAKREFAGNWEYMLDEAIFTAPPHPAWSGAALINHDGKLVGVGSLIVGDASGKGDGVRGNMFVPIDRLPPILGDLIAEGHPLQPAHPWLGLNTDDVGGHLVVSRVTPGAPAEKAGLRKRRHHPRRQRRDPEEPAGPLSQNLGARGGRRQMCPLDVLQNHQRRRFDVPLDQPARSVEAEEHVLNGSACSVERVNTWGSLGAAVAVDRWRKSICALQQSFYVMRARRRSLPLSAAHFNVGSPPS